MAKQIKSATPGGDRVEWEDYKGKLAVIEPFEVEKDINTQHGVSDAIRADVAFLLGPDEQAEFSDTLIFPKVLFQQLKREIGNIVVGRLQQGEKQKGKNAPWILAEATEKDLRKAQDYLNSRSVKSASDGSDDGDDEGDEDDEDAF